MNDHTLKNYLIIGGSRGLGKAFVDGLPHAQDHVFLVSRTPPAARNDFITPIAADLRSLAAHEVVRHAVSDTPLHVLIYNAGIWEDDGFETTEDQTLIDILTVNLTNAMLIAKAMLPNLRQTTAAKIIFIGSTAGLDHHPTDGVAYAASKAGLRGLAHSLREHVRRDGIAVTCLSPGSIATDLDLSAGRKAALGRFSGQRIPVADIVAIVKTLIDLSPAACATEIVLPAQFDAHP